MFATLLARCAQGHAAGHERRASALMHDGLVPLVDVRLTDQFALGHVPGAINVPLGEIKAWSGSADTAKEVVAYRRGPWCVMSSRRWPRFARFAIPRGA